MLKPIPAVAITHRWIRAFKTERIFTEIVEGNGWRGITSPSGRGADPDQTRILIAELSALIRRRKISSLLDVACGEFSWMRSVNLSGIDYVGLDIVREWWTATGRTSPIILHSVMRTCWRTGCLPSIWYFAETALSTFATATYNLR